MSEVCAHSLLLESRMLALLLEHENNSRRRVLQSADHDSVHDIAGMKETVVVSRSQDAISAIYESKVSVNLS